jgi:cytochrome c-type biogenesis protein CcmH/NrfG
MARHDGLLGQALQHYQAARTEEAANACQQALQARPNFAPALHLLGAIRLKQGAAADAVKLLERAVRGDPRNPETSTARSRPMSGRCARSRSTRRRATTWAMRCAAPAG